MVSRFATLATVLVLAGCQTGTRLETETASLAEAKQITADFQGTTFDLPPRTISDIETFLAGIMDRDNAFLRGAAERADLEPPRFEGGSSVFFFMDRSHAAGIVGRAEQSLADMRRAVALAEQPEEGTGNRKLHRINMYRDLALKEYEAGNFRNAQIAMAKAARLRPGSVRNNSILAEFHLALGDAAKTTRFAKRSRKNMGTGNRSCDRISRPVGNRIPCGRYNRHLNKYAVAAVRGRWREAETHLRQVISVFADEWGQRSSGVYRREMWSGFAAEHLASSLAPWRRTLVDVLVRQGRLTEAEFEARRNVKNLTEAVGARSADSASAIGALARVLLEQGRHRDAETLSRAALASLSLAKAPRGSRYVAEAHHLLGKSLVAAGRWEEASREFDLVRDAFEDRPFLFEKWYGRDIDVPLALHLSGRNAEALDLLDKAIGQMRAAFGEDHPDTRLAIALKARILGALGRREAAIGLYRGQIAYLIGKGGWARKSGAGGERRVRRRRIIYEGFLGMVSPEDPTDVEAAFVIADLLQRGSVQLSVTSSAARSAVRDPRLADLVRREQNAGQEIDAVGRMLSDLLTAPPEQRLESLITTLHGRIEELRTARETLGAEIADRFPRYADLVDPPPVSRERIRRILQRDEALITIHVTDESTYVWTLRDSGPMAFHRAALGREDLANMVAAVRLALSPAAERLGDIPEFDAALAHRLYSELLAPTRTVWEDARSLLVAANAPLGQLPFHLLVTADAPVPSETGLLFANYRAVPWLAREHAVTALPSVTALASLRQAVATRAERLAFFGVGDPLFSGVDGETVVARAEPTLVARSFPIVLRNAPRTRSLDRAGIARLPRLPDTRTEIEQIAAALDADPDRDVYLGRAATEAAVKAADLEPYQVVSFATHGLVPGDLDGLAEPALALTAPELGGDSTNDGLLTLSEVLSLRLDADWVVLSACNTGAADGSGAEAFSGLGRAFFFAGTRAMLLSNWPVHSRATMELMRDLFQRQAERPGLTRAEALQRAMLNTMDNGTFVNDRGRRVFSYAHPIFWAPFSVVGDGGL